MFPRSFHFLFWALSSVMGAHAADPLPGHSIHGEAFNEGPRQAAVLMEGTGKVDFAITSESSHAQEFFNQGVGQLHGFWYYEAERSFRQVAVLDPKCAMAYWGLAMANVNNDTRAKAFVKKAGELKASASAREKLWITTLENAYKTDKRDKKQRALDFIRDLENIVHEYPQDVEAKAFLAWKIWHVKGDVPISSAQAVDALLDQVFAANPQHPAHHYRIHLWDGGKAQRALKSAASNGQAAPAIAHMWHMPGHTYSKLGRHDDAAWQQEASTRVDHAYMIRNWILPDQIHNYAHNEEWLVRTFNELGRAKDAQALAESLIANPRHPKYNKTEKGSARFGPQRLMETLVRWELWDRLLRVTSGPLTRRSGNEAIESQRLYSQGLAFAAGEDLPALEAVMTDLQAYNQRVLKKRKAAAKKAEGEEKSKAATGDNAAEKKPAEPTPEKDKKSDAGPADDYLKELKAVHAVLSGRKDASELLDQAAKSMSKERLARCWLRLGEKDKAQTLLKSIPQDLSGHAARAEIWMDLGNKDEARKALTEAGKRAFAMDKDLPLSKRLDALAAELEMKQPWRAAAPVRNDSGARPPLADLGPMHWHPPAAPSWEALTLDGKPVRSKSFAGKPYILIFYLGSACGHCMEQVNAFAKAADDFEKAGIQLAAVTLEPMSLAGRITEHMSTGKLPPFPIWCDPGLGMFKTFMAYDDFEQEPLHAVMLVDAAGKLRWWDISWEPFSDTAFLLQESRRLLRSNDRRPRPEAAE